MPEERAKSVPASKPRLALDPFVDAFMRFHHMDPNRFAAFLGCSPSALELLQGVTVPDDRDPAFRAEVEALARRMGASEARLLQWIRVSKLLVR